MDTSGDIVEVGLHQTDAIELLIIVASDVRENDVILRNTNVLSGGARWFSATIAQLVQQGYSNASSEDRQLRL